MSFRVKRSKVLQVCTDQVADIVLMPQLRNNVWTDESLQVYLAGMGLDYTLEEVQHINDELHTRGIVEDV